MDDKITIIEGPPPTFEAVADGWAMGLNETPALYTVGVTRLRTFNGPALIERCHRAWHSQNGINLEYREPDGLQAATPILAARTVETEEGHVLVLWVRLDADEADLLADTDDDDSDDDYGPGDDDFDDNNPIL